MSTFVQIHLNYMCESVLYACVFVTVDFLCSSSHRRKLLRNLNCSMCASMRIAISAVVLMPPPAVCFFHGSGGSFGNSRKVLA